MIGPFLHIGAVVIMTGLMWVVSQIWLTLSRKGKVVKLSTKKKLSHFSSILVRYFKRIRTGSIHLLIDKATTYFEFKKLALSLREQNAIYEFKYIFLDELYQT